VSDGTQTVRLVFLGDSAAALRATSTVTGGVRGLAVAQKEQAGAADAGAVANTRLGASVAGAGRDVEVAGAKFGAMAATVKSLAFNVLGLGAAFGGALLLKDSIQAADAYTAALRSVNVAIKSTGGSLPAYQADLDRIVAAGGKLGFTNVQVLDGFKQMTLVTGNATAAVRYMGLAEDIARARGVDLGTVAVAIGKAIDGKTASLQRYGVVVAKGETVEQALTDAGRKYAGQAGASTTETEKLHSSVVKLETEIGLALLPTWKKLLADIDDWISKSKNQEKVTGDVTKGLHALVTVLDAARSAVRTVDKATGSFENTLKILIGIRVAAWAVSTAAEIAAVGAAADVALGPVGLLIAALGTLAGLEVLSKQPPGNSGQYRVVNGKYQMNTPTGPRGSEQKWVPVTKAQYLAATGTPGTAPSAGPAGLAADRAAQHASAAAAPTKTPIKTTITPLTFGGGGGSGGGGGGGGGTKKSPVFKLPDELVAKVAAASRVFAEGVTQSHLDTLGSLEAQEIGLLKVHGEKAQAEAILTKIEAAGTKLQAKIAQTQLDAANAMIAKLAAAVTGDAATLKLDTAVHAPVATILADQVSLLGGYQQEAMTLKARLDASRGKAQAAYKTALAKIEATVASTQDSIAASLDTISQTAETALQTVIASIETSADAALGSQYSQGGLQTPAEARLAAMQTADTTKSLQDTLTAAQTQLATDQAGTSDTSGTLTQIQAAIGKAALANATDKAQSSVLGISPGSVSSDTLISQLRQLLVQQSLPDPTVVAADQAAVTAAQRAIDENNLQTQATAERTTADQGYAQATFNLNAQIEALAANAGDGVGVQGQLNTLLASFGVTLSGLADPGGNGLLKQLSDAVATATLAFTNMMLYAQNPAGGVNQGGQGGTVASTDPGAINASGLLGAAQAGTIRTAPFGTVIGMAGGGEGIAVRPTLFLAGEAGREHYRFTPLGGGMSSSTGSGGHGLHDVHVHLEGDLAALGDFVKIKAVEATPAISSAIGRNANLRGRSGRF
jgi:hypothetical protein